MRLRFEGHHNNRGFYIHIDEDPNRSREKFEAKSRYPVRDKVEEKKPSDKNLGVFQIQHPMGILDVPPRT